MIYMGDIPVHLPAAQNETVEGNDYIEGRRDYQKRVFNSVQDAVSLRMESGVIQGKTWCTSHKGSDGSRQGLQGMGTAGGGK